MCERTLHRMPERPGLSILPTEQLPGVTTATTTGVTPTSLRFQAWKGMVKAHPHRGDRLRRLINIAVATVLIVVTAPIMFVIWLAIRLTSPGPAIYSQPRVGLDRRLERGPGMLNPRRQSDHGGRIFTIYKFRTMRVQDVDAPQSWATEDDPRITPIGRILRSFRLDELPQVFNVLKGDMNMVGPRPEQPDIFDDIRGELGSYPRRQRVLPGITGLAQVSLPYDSDILDVQRKVELDLKYVRQRSPGEDLLIMAKTMPVMVKRSGWK
jgi:lipopolysaccharide/colanic/teichoic acid biosynthesis glycosyltransferase